MINVTLIFSHAKIQNRVPSDYRCHQWVLKLVMLFVHYNDVIMGAMASQITSLTIVYSTGEFPAQMASNAENVSIWWRHNVDTRCIESPATIQIYPTTLCMYNINTASTLPVARHYSDVIMSVMASQITGISSVCSIVCSGADQR